jgi:glycosyltransferase involved in cell wall biosynthesis
MVTMIPRGPAGHLAAYIKACDCLVIPSRQESIPVVFSEAIQMGIPMLVTDTGDMGTLAREHGLMDPVPPEDADALASAMRAFADDSAEFKRLFSAARTELLRMFDPEMIVDRFLAAVSEGSSPREAD